MNHVCNLGKLYFRVASPGLMLTKKIKKVNIDDLKVNDQQNPHRY